MSIRRALAAVAALTGILLSGCSAEQTERTEQTEGYKLVGREFGNISLGDQIETCQKFKKDPKALVGDAQPQLQRSFPFIEVTIEDTEDALSDLCVVEETENVKDLKKRYAKTGETNGTCHAYDQSHLETVEALWTELTRHEPESTLTTIEVDRALADICAEAE